MAQEKLQPEQTSEVVPYSNTAQDIDEAHQQEMGASLEATPLAAAEPDPEEATPSEAAASLRAVAIERFRMTNVAYVNLLSALNQSMPRPTVDRSLKKIQVADMTSNILNREQQQISDDELSGSWGDAATWHPDNTTDY
jgi:hypothetical protein